MHAGTGRVGDNDVGAPMPFDEVAIEDVLHVAGKELGVPDAIYLRVHAGILDGLGHILDADDLACLARNKVGNGARARIEVIDEFGARELRQLARDLI